MARRPATIAPKERLLDCPEMDVGLALPLPVTRRLDLLTRRLDEAGDRGYRKELIAALILAAPEDGAELADLLRRYRTALARDAAVKGSAAAAVLEGERPAPGRRRRVR